MFQTSVNLTRSWEGGRWTVESTPINIREYFKNDSQHESGIFRLLIFIFWGHFLNISDPYLFFFLQKLEPFCRGWLEKFCLVAKIQHFLPYLKTQVKSQFGLDNFINKCYLVHLLYFCKNGVYTGIRCPLNIFLKNYTKNHQKSGNFNNFLLTSAIFRG